MTRVRKLRRLAAALSIAGLGAAGAAGAAQLTVNSAGDDTTAADGLVTLREAIAAAEADAATDLGDTGSGDDVIVFDPALTAGGDATITLGTVGDTRFGPAAFAITTTLTIRGATGENGILLLRSGAIPSLRHFNVADTGDLTLENLQLAGGRAKGGDGGTNLGDDGGGGGGGAGLGGAVFNAGTLTARACTLSGNTAQGGVGGAGADDLGVDSGGGGGGGGLGGNGGIVPNTGTDHAAGGGGTLGNGGDAGATGGGGGGTQTSGTSAGVGGTDNGGTGGAGGVAGGDATGPGGGGGGGGDESAGGAGGFGGGGGGAGENDSNSAKVGGAGGLGGGGGGGGEDQHGGAGGFGGGGGGGNNDGTGPAVSGAGGFGGGNGGDDGNGAVAESAGGGGGAGLGGAIFNLGGTLTLENCTLSANAAAGGTGGTSTTVLPGTDGSGLGGALFNLNGTVSLLSTTFASNTAGVGADVYNLGHLAQGGVPDGSATVDVEGSILNSVGNGNAVATQALGVADTDAALHFVGTNLTQLALQNLGGVVTGALTVTDAQLGPLTDNGGPTATHALTYPGSPAIDAAADGPATDQRGAARPEGVSFDVGSVEVAQSCGDGVVTQDEACDDGNTVEGDGCSAACEETCAPAPELMCAPASAASLSIDERKPGKEKLKASLKKFAAGVATADFGDPVAGDTAVRICVYDGADALALDVLVDRAGDLCGAKPCWKALKTTGFAYKDALAAADGVDKIGAKSGAAGKGSLTVSAKNNQKKGQTALPTGAAALLEGDTSATVQVLTSDAGCFEGSLTAVKSADGTQFKAK